MKSLKEYALNPFRRHFLQGLVASSALASDSASAQIAQPLGKFRILSLDGGGVRGFLSAGFLSNVESIINNETNSKRPLGERFDLIAGTSTGGIIALALAMGKNASEVKDFYDRLIPEIFSNSEKSFYISRYWKPELRNDKLKGALEEYFGTSTLENVVSDVCITSVSLENGKPRLHKSDYKGSYKTRLDTKLSDIALATSAAPTYFPACDIKYSTRLIDGGICANNPSMIAMVDAVNFERKSKRGRRQASDIRSDVVLMSIGTGDQKNALSYDPNDLAHAGLIGWAQHITEVIFQSQSEIAHQQVFALLSNDNYYRFNPILNHVVDLDDAERYRSLQGEMDVEQPAIKFIRSNLLS